MTLKRIPENWEKIEEYEKQIQERTGDPQARFNASIFWLGVDRHLALPCQYRSKKGKKGQETFTQSYKDILVYASYCPFTGKPLFEEVDE